MAITEVWRKRGRDHRFVALDRFVVQFWEATQAKDEAEIQRIMLASADFCNKKRGMENTRAMYYIKLMREIKKQGWSHVEIEHDRIVKYLKDKAETAQEHSESEKKRLGLLEQLKHGVIGSYMEQIKADKHKQEQAAMKALKQKEDEAHAEEDRIKKAKARGYV